MFTPFKLKSTVGSAFRVDPDDIVKTKQVLQQSGHYAPPTEFGITDFTDRQMFDGLKQFQNDNGLNADGVARPGGPTELTIRSKQAGLKLSQIENKNSINESSAVARGVFGLAGSVGQDQDNAERDKRAMKNALAWTGTLTRQEAARNDRRSDEDMQWGLWRFQRQFNLTPDGFARPGGETERTLNRLIGPLVRLAMVETERQDGAEQAPPSAPPSAPLPDSPGEGAPDQPPPEDAPDTPEDVPETPPEEDGGGDNQDEQKPEQEKPACPDPKLIENVRANLAERQRDLDEELEKFAKAERHLTEMEVNLGKALADLARDIPTDLRRCLKLRDPRLMGACIAGHGGIHFHNYKTALTARNEAEHLFDVAKSGVESARGLHQDIADQLNKLLDQQQKCQ